VNMDLPPTSSSRHHCTSIVHSLFTLRTEEKGRLPSDVAHEVGDLVLLGNFDKIIDRISLGRLVFQNLQKVISRLLPARRRCALAPIEDVKELDEMRKQRHRDPESAATAKDFVAAITHKNPGGSKVDILKNFSSILQLPSTRNGVKPDDLLPIADGIVR
jgi:hypothetical protein